MAFNHAVYNQRFLTNPGNEAGKYGITIAPASAVPGRPHAVMIDKPTNEAGANVPMYWNDTLSIYVAGDIPGDKAQGFHIRHEDEEPGTTRGHHSFYVVWQRQTVTEPEPEPEPTPGGDWRDDFSGDELRVIKRFLGKMMDLADGKA